MENLTAHQRILLDGFNSVNQRFLVIILSSSVYSPFSYRVGLPPHTAPFPGGDNEEYWSSIFYDRMPFLT